jgi:uncharacterized protein
MEIINVTQNQIVAGRARKAERLLERMRGLIGSPPIQDGEALVLPKCQGIHMFGMTYAIDAIYLDQKGTVVRLVSDLPPNRFGPVSFRADSVIELPEGTIKRLGVRLGDQLSFFENGKK